MLVATAPGAGPRACSLLLVDKRRLDPGSFHCLPPVATHGVRGIDLSGIAFRDAVVPRSALIGPEGSGLEQLLRLLQISKTLVCHLALGGGETGLRLATAFLCERTLYRTRAIELPDARDGLAGAFADLLVADSLATLTARALHLQPQLGSLLSAAAKYFVPVQADALLRTLGVLLGARSYLAGPPDGVFEKIQRDTALMSLFDGSTRVNLSHVASLLSTARDESSLGEPPHPALLRLDAALPTLDLRTLRLSSSGRGLSLELLNRAQTALTKTAAEEDASNPGLRWVCERFEARLAAFRSKLASGSAVTARSRAALRLAEDYSELMAAAAAIHFWVENRAAAAPFFARGRWLTVGLGRLLAGELTADPWADEAHGEVAQEAIRRHQSGLHFSLGEARA